MTTSEVIKQPVPVQERVQRLAQSVGGLAALQEMASRHGINDGITPVETVAISTVLFRLGREPQASDEADNDLNPYARARVGFLLVDIRTNPEPRDIALAGLLADLRHLRDTDELITRASTYPVFLPNSLAE